MEFIVDELLNLKSRAKFLVHIVRIPYLGHVCPIVMKGLILYIFFYHKLPKVIFENVYYFTKHNKKNLVRLITCKKCVFISAEVKKKKEDCYNIATTNIVLLQLIK